MKGTAMYSLYIEFIDGTSLEKTAAYSYTISLWAFDAWQRRNDTICVTLTSPRGKVLAIADKRDADYVAAPKRKPRNMAGRR
jgi:hypothetical protein